MSNKIATTMLVLFLVSVTSFSSPKELNNKVSKYSKRLDLNDDQLNNIKPILLEGSEEKKIILEKIQSADKKRDLRKFTKELKKLNETTDKKLATILNKKQMNEWSEIRTEIKEKYTT